MNRCKPNRHLLLTLLVGGALSLLAQTLSAQSQSVQNAGQGKDPETLVGPCSVADLHAPERRNHFQPIPPNPNGIRAGMLKPLLDSIELILFLGTWCEDSHEQVPHILSELDAAGFPIHRTDDARWQMVCVSEDKSQPADAVSERSIEYVPTLVVLKHGIELGRIVETPYVGWTEDVLDILDQQDH